MRWFRKRAGHRPQTVALRLEIVDALLQAIFDGIAGPGIEAGALLPEIEDLP